MAKYKPMKFGPGPEALPPKGYERGEVLRKRTDTLNKISEGLLANTDVGLYSVDPEKLKAEPEVLKHLNFADFAFTVSRPKKGYAYFWCLDKPIAIAQKKSEATRWLGATARGWEIVGNCSCVGDKHDQSTCPYPESLEVKEVDGRRRIADIILMRMNMDDYVKMNKRIMLVQRYKELNVPEPMADWVARNENLVQVVSGPQTPDKLYQQVQQGGRLIHGFRGVMNQGPMIRASDYDAQK